MNVSLIKPDDFGYPTAVADKLGNRPAIAAIGNFDLFQSRPLALFCSNKCPGDTILRTYDIIRALRDAGVAMIGGFHSPMEKECLTLLLRGSQPIIICPGRSIDGMRVPAEWKEALAVKRLLMLSPFARTQRITAKVSRTRNLFVAALAGQILVAHAAPRSKTEAFFCQLLTWDKPLWTLPSHENTNLLASGAKPLKAEDVVELAKEMTRLNTK